MFETPLFWALLLITAAFFHVSSDEQVRSRALLLTLASLLALIFVVGLNPFWIVFLVAATAWIIVGLRLTRRMAARHSYRASFLVILPILVAWALGKQAVALEWSALGVLYFVGFSFYLIKAWTLVRDYHEGLIERFDPYVALAYFLFFPVYIAGPMHVYNEFDAGLRHRLGLEGETLVDIVFRLLLGLVKIKLIAALFLPLSLEAVKESSILSLRRIGIGSFAYSIVIWADFSGYSDLAIGSSRLLGLYTPENFNYPYGAANIREFWQRWHMSFSRVLMSYVFVPLSRNLQTAFNRRGRAVLITASLVTFLFCGYWHGPTLNFMLWGLYHGLGIVAYDIYRRGANKRRAKDRGRTRSPFYEKTSYCLSVALTFAFVSFGWIFFVLPTGMIFRR